MSVDKRIDAYIAKSAPFAQPILQHLRALIHQACPDVEETMKWSFPHFDYKGVMCSMAAFKQHCAFNFWKAPLLKDPKGVLKERAAQGGEGMGHLGRITSLKDLPPDKALLDLMRQAKKLNDDNVKLPVREKKPAAPLDVPDYFATALKKNKKAWEQFETWAPSHRKEYILWITEAKRDETREKRIATAVEWISEGKGRNWKSEKPKVS